MSGPERAPHDKGRKSGADASGAAVAQQAAANGVRNIWGRLSPDPERVAENCRTFFAIEETYPRDLLGEPVSPGRGRKGRPRHVPTPATRARVIALRGEGKSIRAIALELGVSHPTLQQNYPVELQSGSSAWRRRAGDHPQAAGAAALTNEGD